MPGARRFIEVRFDASGTVAARQTGAHAGSSLDAILDSPGTGGAPAGWRGVGIARNLPEAQLDQVLAGLESRFGARIQVVTRGPGRCVFRFGLGSAIPDAAADLLLTLGEGKGAPWVRVAGGEVMLRAEAGGDPEGQVRAVRKALEVTGLPGDVRGVELSGAELGQWLEVHGVLEALQEPGALDASRLPTTITPGTP